MAQEQIRTIQWQPHKENSASLIEGIWDKIKVQINLLVVLSLIKEKILLL